MLWVLIENCLVWYWFSVFYGKLSFNWATSWENLFLPYANNKDAVQPRIRSLISAFVVRCLDCIISVLSIYKISRPWLVSVAEQAGLSITRSQTQKTGFLVTRLNYYQIPSSLVSLMYPNYRNDNICQQIIQYLMFTNHNAPIFHNLNDFLSIFLRGNFS